MELFKTLLVALVASLFCLHLLKPLAIKIGLVDYPNERKQHEYAVPLIGGIVIFFGFCFSLLTFHISLVHYRGLLAGSSLLVLMGVVDDFHNISSRLRLIGQLTAAFLLIIWSGATIQNLGNLFFLGNVSLNMWAIPFTLLVIMTNLNAMNMLDGQDGLAGGVALGQALLLAYSCFHFTVLKDMHLLLIIAALLCVFLSFNMRFPWRRHAAIFLGDAGSTLIGFLLVWFAIRLSQYNTSTLEPITLLWVMSFPIFDLLNVVIYRARQRRSILRASRDHIHHVLHVLGMSSVLSTWLLVFFSVSLGLVGLMLNRLSIAESWQFVIWLSTLIVYLLGVQVSRHVHQC